MARFVRIRKKAQPITDPRARMDCKGGGAAKILHHPGEARLRTTRLVNALESSRGMAHVLTLRGPPTRLILVGLGWQVETQGLLTGMASDLSGLQRTEKTKVAGLLSKTISGAEVKKGCVRCC